MCCWSQNNKNHSEVQTVPANALFTFSLWWVYGARVLPIHTPLSVPPPYGGRRRLWIFCMDSRAPRPLRFCFIASEACRHIVGGIAESPHGHREEAVHSKTVREAAQHRTISAQPLYGSRTGSVRFQCGGCGHCMATQLHCDCMIYVQSQRSLCTDLPRPAPEGLYKKLNDAHRQCEHIHHSP